MAPAKINTYTVLCLGPLVNSCSQKPLNYLAFQSFNIEHSTVPDEVYSRNVLHAFN
jgi:hypothetical protein